jgi:hypothetical protein
MASKQMIGMGRKRRGRRMRQMNIVEAKDIIGMESAEKVEIEFLCLQNWGMALLELDQNSWNWVGMIWKWAKNWRSRLRKKDGCAGEGTLL